jgi:hypothetical protein
VKRRARLLLRALPTPAVPEGERRWTVGHDRERRGIEPHTTSAAQVARAVGLECDVGGRAAVPNSAGVAADPDLAGDVARADGLECELCGRAAPRAGARASAHQGFAAHLMRAAALAHGRDLRALRVARARRLALSLGLSARVARLQ